MGGRGFIRHAHSALRLAFFKTGRLFLHSSPMHPGHDATGGLKLGVGEVHRQLDKGGWGALFFLTLWPHNHPTV